MRRGAEVAAAALAALVVGVAAPWAVGRAGAQASAADAGAQIDQVAGELAGLDTQVTQLQAALAQADAVLATAQASVEEIRQEATSREQLQAQLVGQARAYAIQRYMYGSADSRDHLAFLSAKADTGDSHPVKRGDTILRRTLCMEFKLPDNVPPVADSTPGGSTTRERFSMHAMMPCATCHVLIDPIGFAFEEFDAIGAFRTTDQGKKVDSSGTASTPGGATLKFNDAVELMTQMAGLPEVGDCMTTQWLRYMLGRREVAGESPSQKVILDEFKKANYDLKAMLVALTRTRTFTHRSASPGEVTQ